LLPHNEIPFFFETGNDVVARSELSLLNIKKAYFAQRGELASNPASGIYPK
jgi:hypothetical protein